MNYKEYQDLEAEQLKNKIMILSNTYSVSKNSAQYARVLKIYISKNPAISEFISLTKFLANKGVNLMNIEKDSSYYYTSSDYSSYKTIMGHLYSNYCQHLTNLQYKPGSTNPSSYIEALKLVDSLGGQLEKDIYWRIELLKKVDKLNSREIDPVFVYMLNTHGIDIIKHSGKNRYYYSNESASKGGLYQVVKEGAKEYLDFLFSIAKNTNKDGLLNSMVKSMLKDEYKNEHSSISTNTLFLALEEELGIKKEQRIIKESLQKFNKKKLKKKKKEQLLNLTSSDAPNTLTPGPKKFKL